MGKPRLSKVAMGADECESKEINCLSCGKLFKSFNPKCIRICSSCKRNPVRRKSSEIEAAKDKRIPASSNHGPDRVRKQQSKF